MTDPILSLSESPQLEWVWFLRSICEQSTRGSPARTGGQTRKGKVCFATTPSRPPPPRMPKSSAFTMHATLIPFHIHVTCSASPFISRAVHSPYNHVGIMPYDSTHDVCRYCLASHCATLVHPAHADCPPHARTANHKQQYWSRQTCQRQEA